MHRKLIGVSSAVALFAFASGYATIGYAHEQGDLCNGILDGDGEPVLESDDDVLGHSGSAPCASAAKAEVDTGAASSKVVAVVEPNKPAPVTVEPVTVYFDINEDKLSTKADAEIRAFAQRLSVSEPKKVWVVGYTDTSGSADLNRRLSKARADSVVAALVDAGVPADILAVDAEGENSPAVATPDGAREAENRRVTVSPQY